MDDQPKGSGRVYDCYYCPIQKATQEDTGPNGDHNIIVAIIIVAHCDSSVIWEVNHCCTKDCDR